MSELISFHVYENDVFYASADGPRKEAAREALNYAQIVLADGGKATIYEVDTKEISLSALRDACE